MGPRVGRATALTVIAALLAAAVGAAITTRRGSDLATQPIGAAAYAATTTAPPPPLAWNAPQPLAAALSGSNGVSRALGAGLGCDGDTPIQESHLLLEAPLPAAVFSQLTGTARANLAIEASGKDRLEPTTSHVTLGNERGTVQLQLNGGACPASNLNIGGGGSRSGSGALALVSGTGAYRNIKVTGGSWNLTTGIAPGADNAWTLGLNGQLAVLSPGLALAVDSTFWGNYGLDYVSRIVTVVYRVTNNGPGDAYGVKLNTTSSTQSGVTALGPTPQSLGDLLSGESTTVQVRYKLGLIGPCALVILNCTFPTTLTVGMPDALDTAANKTASATVHAPTLPPPA